MEKGVLIHDNHDLEYLLNQIDSIALPEDKTKKSTDGCELPHGGTAKDMQRADKNASLYDFIDMVAKIVDYTMKDLDVTFLSDERQSIIKDPEIPTNHAFISYRVISRKSKDEYKPIVREEIIEHDENNKQRIGQVYGQRFDCTVQFNIFSAENKVATKVMEKFEELMIAYAGYFKKQGVQELFFEEQLTDNEYNNFRETLSVRNLRYYVQVEKLTVIFNRRVDDIILVGDTVKNKDNNTN